MTWAVVRVCLPLVKVEKENKKKEEPKKVMANEEKVDLLLQMLSTADATSESPGENETIVELESMQAAWNQIWCKVGEKC